MEDPYSMVFQRTFYQSLHTDAKSADVLNGWTTTNEKDIVYMYMCVCSWICKQPITGNKDHIIQLFYYQCYITIIVLARYVDSL